MLVLTSRTPAIQPSLTSFSQTNHPTQIEITAGTSNNSSLKLCSVCHIYSFY